MRNFTFEMIVPLIPIALFIALRILEARRKRIAQQGNRELAALVASKLKEPEPLVTFIEMDREDAPQKRPRVLETEARTLEPASTGDTIKGKGKNPLSDNLARLSPLKQAVLWAEILGPPRGLQDSVGAHLGDAASGIKPRTTRINLHE